MLEIQSQSKETVDSAMREETGVATKWTRDTRGNEFGWLHLKEPDLLSDAARILSGMKARLMTVTAYAEKREDADLRRSIAYHFALRGMVYTVTIPTYNVATGKNLPVPSITSYFLNADWNEREFKELYNINIQNHPNPKRLFLDPRIDAGVMSTLLPFSAIANGAAGRGLWEQVMLAKGVDISSTPLVADPHIAAGTGKELVTHEPKVTPVTKRVARKLDEGQPEIEVRVLVRAGEEQAAQVAPAAQAAVAEGVPVKLIAKDGKTPDKTAKKAVKAPVEKPAKKSASKGGKTTATRKPASTGAAGAKKRPVIKP